MRKEIWVRHMESLGLPVVVPATTEGIADAKRSLEHMRAGCSVCVARKKTRRAIRRRRERDDVMRSLGLVKTPYGWE